MVRHKLDSVNAFARQGYDLRIRCMACEHVKDASAVEMMLKLGERRLSMSIEALEDRLKCQTCGERRAHISPVPIDF
ncbi:hypothetical protein [Aurantiacibacter sp. MUD61]|uniref:hypothetical protein n=1 Tax=Aurantiacibacter sp. MUD61 TaxID=3009083 RepID=UPI0022F0B9A1|nr:hypothetical protein [Aurantiacibacter sp. MUD61]